MASRLAAACAALALSAAPALAQGMLCGDRDSMVKRLETGFGEAQQSYGLVNGRAVVEIWVSPDTGSFTILRTMSDGRSCIIAAGEAWRVKDLAAFIPGEAA